MRITAGEFRGRRLAVPSVAGLRPTSAKVRQALFNIIPPLLRGGHLRGARLLDLFAGSGIIAIEALSRGASHVTSCESDAQALRAMREVADTLNLSPTQWQQLHHPLPLALTALQGQHFDLVFADPPYRQPLAKHIPTWLEKQQISCDLLVVEEATDTPLTWPQHWQEVTSPRRYGHTTLHFIHRT
ncbi:MAG: 16S rRNA (guanine(966)-N(2))-methyltransferase RsmD [Mariprofundaceae bacterium]|nr:16S rRNA (guanine(966)-N(2))-methyltransferase RsmD [Mariprofundaceae bacterium]